MLLRILPPGLYGHRALRVIERMSLYSRRHWRIMLSGFLEPVLYVFAFQWGFGALVGDVQGPGGQPMSYVAFVAPALLAASAMNGAIFETTFPIYFKLRYQRTYDAMLATPIGPADIAAGEIGWAVIRGGVYSAGFLAIMAVLGLVTSPWAVLILPVALLIAFTFAAIGMALSTFIKSPSQFDYIQLAVVPLFLFSTTFFPLSVYPPSLQWLVQASPLYHGVELTRGLAVGAVDAGMLGHVALLLVLASIGLFATSRRIATLLLR